MHHRALLIACLAALPALPAAAAEGTGFYVNAKWGESDTEASIGDIFDTVIDGKEDSTAYEIGWRMNNLIALQAGYHDLGKFSALSACPPEALALCGGPGIGTATDTIGYSLSLVPQLPLTKSMSVFGKIGIVALEGDVEAVLDDGSQFIEDVSDEDIIYGAGLKLRLTGRLSIFYELEYLGSDVESQYLGASFQF